MNQRTRKRTDLQSVAIDRSATPPRYKLLRKFHSAKAIPSTCQYFRTIFLQKNYIKPSFYAHLLPPYQLYP